MPAPECRCEIRYSGSEAYIDYCALHASADEMAVALSNVSDFLTIFELTVHLGGLAEEERQAHIENIQTILATISGVPMKP